MPLFRCEECGCIENTALGFYHCRDDDSFKWPVGIHGRALCSQHGPKLYSDGTSTEYGEWHGKFKQKSAAGMLIDNHGFLWDKAAAQSGYLPRGYTIVGEVPADEEQVNSSNPGET